MKNFSSMLVGVVVLTGCSNGPNLVGKWEGKIDNASAEQAKDDASKIGQGLADAFTGAFKASLELKQDKTFVATMVFIPIEGTWAQTGTKVTLKPTKIFGKTPQQVAKQDAQSAFTVDGTAKEMTLTFDPTTDELILNESVGKSTSQFVFTRPKP